METINKEIIFIAYRDLLLKALRKGVISWAVFEASLIEIRKELGLPTCTHCQCYLLT